MFAMSAGDYVSGRQISPSGRRFKLPEEMTKVKVEDGQIVAMEVCPAPLAPAWDFMEHMDAVIATEFA